MIKLGIVQFAPLLGEVTANIDRISDIITLSAACDMYVLPELANSGYRFKDRAEALSYAEEIGSSYFVDKLKSLAQERKAYIVSGFCERDGAKLYNSALLIGPEGLVGVYRKLHLFMDEKDIFEPGDKGLPVFDTSIGKIGLLVCFDWMFPEAWRVLALKGAQLIAHPSNLVLPYCQEVMPSYALLNRCFIATANRVGQEKDLTFTGQSVLTSPKGEVLMRGGVNDTKLLSAEVDLNMAFDKNITGRNHCIEDRRSDVYGDLMVGEHD